MSFRHLSHILSGAAVLLLAATACTQDELAEGTLPEGEYPVVIRATGLSVEATPQAAPSTRATVDGDWQGVQTVALKMGDAVKEYTVTATDADGYKSATLSRTDDPHYWTSRDPITVSAWWPLDDTDITWMPAVKVAEDQSMLAAFQGSDFISAENQTVTFSDPKLTFTHRTARVAIELKPGTGFTSVDGATVSLVSLSADNGNPTAIKTYHASGNSYEALTAPQTVAKGEPFIRVELGGGNFYFRPQNDVVLEAGNRYTYTVKVNATGLTLAGCEIGKWDDGGGESGAAEDLTSYTEYQADDLKIGDYYYSDGTWSDGGLRKLYADGTMEWTAITPEPVSGKTPIAIVFYTGRHEKDNSDYTVPLTEDGPVLADGTVHGYAVALTDVHNNDDDRLRWEYGPNKEYNQAVGTFTEHTSDWSGYANCLKINEFVKNHSSDNWEMKHFPSAFVCETYGNRTIDQSGKPITDGRYNWQQPFIAPENSSGWFLPSCDQLYYCWQNGDFLEERINVVKDKTDNTTLKKHIGWFRTNDWFYWSSTEYWYDSTIPKNVWYVNFLDGHRGATGKNVVLYVRAILAF